MGWLKRREEMWQVSQALEKGRLVLGFKIIASYIFKGRAREKHMDGSAKDLDFVNKLAVKKFSAVLDQEELDQFLGPKGWREIPPEDLECWKKKGKKPPRP